MVYQSKIGQFLAGDYRWRIAGLSFLCCWLLSCSIHAPEVRITRDQPALEKQLLGNYQRLTDASQLLVTTPAPQRSPLVAGANSRTVLTALQNQQFNREIIGQLKHSGIIGENNRGLLEIIPRDQSTESAEIQQRALRLVAEENRARQIILTRLLQIDPRLAMQDPEQVEIILARFYADRSESGSWIQQEDGQWVKK